MSQNIKQLNQAIKIVKQKLQEWSSLEEIKTSFLSANSSAKDWEYVLKEVKSNRLPNKNKKNWFVPWLCFILIMQFLACLYIFKVQYKSDNYWGLILFYLGLIAEIGLLYVLISRNSKNHVKMWPYVLFLVLHIILWIFSGYLQLISAGFFMFLVFQVEFMWFVLIYIIIFIYELILGSIVAGLLS